MATNITPIEMLEESSYNMLTTISLSGLVGSLLMLTHMLVFHSMFSYLYVTLAVIFGLGAFLFPWLRSKRFGERNVSLGERVWKIEQALGEPA